uniref:Uncharacterized protein n=1 Tax=Romanomermis culicivorax TaxID=13658 RepID=A0A915J3X7_ROMCU
MVIKVFLNSVPADNDLVGGDVGVHRKKRRSLRDSFRAYLGFHPGQRRRRQLPQIDYVSNNVEQQHRLAGVIGGRRVLPQLNNSLRFAQGQLMAMAGINPAFLAAVNASAAEGYGSNTRFGPYAARMHQSAATNMELSYSGQSSLDNHTDENEPSVAFSSSVTPASLRRHNFNCRYVSGDDPARYFGFSSGLNRNQQCSFEEYNGQDLENADASVMPSHIIQYNPIVWHSSEISDNTYNSYQYMNEMPADRYVDSGRSLADVLIEKVLEVQRDDQYIYQTPDNPYYNNFDEATNSSDIWNRNRDESKRSGHYRSKNRNSSTSLNDDDHETYVFNKDARSESFDRNVTSSDRRRTHHFGGVSPDKFRDFSCNRGHCSKEDPTSLLLKQQDSVDSNNDSGRAVQGGDPAAQQADNFGPPTTLLPGGPTVFVSFFTLSCLSSFITDNLKINLFFPRRTDENNRISVAKFLQPSALSFLSCPSRRVTRPSCATLPNGPKALLSG